MDRKIETVDKENRMIDIYDAHTQLIDTISYN